MELKMGVNDSFVAGAVLAGLVAMASSGFASEPVVPDALKPNTSRSRINGRRATSRRMGRSRRSIARWQALRQGFLLRRFFRGQENGRRKNHGSADQQCRKQDAALGTTAKVTNLETGKSAVVTIQDRGPYVDGRIVDLSPATAQKIGITRRAGIAR